MYIYNKKIEYIISANKIFIIYNNKMHTKSHILLHITERKKNAIL